MGQDPYKLTFELAPVGMAHVSLEGRWLNVNDRLCEIVGYAKEELLKKTFQDITHPNDIRPDLDLLQQLVSGKIDKYHMQKRYIRPDRSTVWVDLSVSLVRNEKNDPDYYISIIRDITDSIETSQEVINRENRLHSIFRAAPIGIGLVENRIIRQVNDRLVEITGYSREEMVGRNARLLYPDEQEYEWVGREKYSQISKFGTGTVETRWKTKSGRVVDILLSSTPLDLNDIAKGVTFTALDITETKNIQKQLSERLEFEKLLSSVSGMFMNLPGEMITDKLREALELVKNTLGLERVNLYTYNPVEETLSIVNFNLIHSASGDGIEPIDNDINKTYAGRLNWYYEKLQQQDYLALNGLPDSLPRNAEGEKDYAERHRIRSHLSISLIFEENFIGALTVDSITSDVHWSDELVGRMKLLGDIFANCLARVKFEERLRDTRSRYQALFDHAADAFMIMRGDKFIDCNICAEKMFGRSKEEITGKNPIELSPEFQPGRGRSSDLAAEKISAAIRGEAQNFEWVHTRGDGSTFDAEVTLNRMDTEDEKLLLAVVRDISDRKRTQREIESIRSTLVTALEQSPAGIIIADAPNVRIRLVNSAALGIRGRQREELINIPVEKHFERWQTYYPDGSEYPPEKLPLSRAILKGEVTENEEIIIQRSDGEKRWVLTNASPVKDQDGKIIAGIVVFPDITEMKQAYEEKEKLLAMLASKNEELESIIYASSHDLRSPLVNILGFSGEMKSGCEKLEQVIRSCDDPQELREKIKALVEQDLKESMEYISSSAEKMNLLLNALLKLCRLGQSELHIEYIDMNDLCSSILSSMQYQIRETGADVQVAPLPGCKGDITQLTQVLTNLLDNALKYLDPAKKGRIEISGEKQDGQCIYAVTDNGIGMSKEHSDKIFEVFHRLNPNQGSDGEGIGLTYVRRILGMHGGRIWVESAPGKGSSFYISIPENS